MAQIQTGMVRILFVVLVEYACVDFPECPESVCWNANIMREEYPPVRALAQHCQTVWSIHEVKHIRRSHVFGYLMIQRHRGASKASLQEVVHLVCECEQTLCWLTDCIHSMAETAADSKAAHCVLREINDKAKPCLEARRQKWRDSDATALLEGFHSGKSYKQLGQMLGVTAERCRLKLRSLGVLPARRRANGDQVATKCEA